MSLLALLRSARVMGLLRFVPPLAAAAVLFVSSATTSLVGLAQGFSALFIGAGVLAALLIGRYDIRVHLPLVLSMIGVALAGLTRTGPPYMIASGLYVAATLLSLRLPAIGARLSAASAATEETELALAKRAPASRPLATAVAVTVTTAVTGALVTVLPPASRLAERFVQRYSGDYVAGQEDRVGFASKIRVGAMGKALQSDRVVLRIDGERPEYLRGAVLDVYDRRVWSSSRAEKRTELRTDAPLESSTTRIFFSRTAMSLPSDAPRWFVPNDACDLHTNSGHVKVDAHRTMEPDPPADARMIGFRRAGPGGSGCQLVPPRPVPPGKIDLALAEKIRAEVAPLAAKWAADAKSPREAMNAFVAELGKYEYALEERREGRVDPVVDFLYNVRRGDCEHFASGLVLLARTSGIPARIVVGYRVSEENPVTGMAVVRDRNAHSWVEAWIDGDWVTYDPTPLIDLDASTRPSKLQHFTEAISWWWDRTIAFFQRLGLLGAGLFFGITAAVLLVVRRFMQGRKGRSDVERAASRPLPAFESLSVALERAGLVRAPSEPLERFARRVAASEAPWAAEVARVIGRYAEHRYGGVAKESDVVSALAKATKLTS